MADDSLIELARYCPDCHRPLHTNSPHVTPGNDELLLRHPTTRRWHHLTCHIHTRRTQGGAATVRH